MIQVLSLLLLSLWMTPSAAQLDSSSAVLLRSSGKTTSPKNLDSSRYKIRTPESRKDDDEIEERPGTYIASPVPSKPTQAKAVKVETPPPAPPPPAAAPVYGPVPPPENDEFVEERPPVTEQVRELILGGTTEDIEEYRKQIHPEDPRANVLDITIAPAYYYNDSNSEYSFRRYTSHGIGLGLGMNLWMTPFFGLNSKFFSSVSGSQRSGGTNIVPIDIQTFSAGLRFRKHFGYSRKAAHLSWGIDYYDAMNKISKESTTAVGRKSAGFGLTLEGVVPSSNTYAHTFDVGILPRLKHSEMNTGVEARSGSKNETNSVSMSVGGQWTLDRRNQVFWRTHYTVETNLFDGETSIPDPHTDATPDGVSVTNSLMMFYFGFKWGS